MTMWIRVPGPGARTEPTKREAQHRTFARPSSFAAATRLWFDLLAGSSGILGDALAVALGERQS